MRLTEGREECIVEFAWLLSREFAPPLPLLLDAAFASTLELGRRGTGQPLHALQVELKRNPVHCDIHEAHSLEPAGTACLLGYEDPNSFFRAFHEWEGTTPGEWRAAQRGWSRLSEQTEQSTLLLD